MVELIWISSNMWNSRFMEKTRGRLLECKRWWDKCKSLKDFYKCKTIRDHNSLFFLKIDKIDPEETQIRQLLQIQLIIELQFRHRLCLVLLQRISNRQCHRPLKDSSQPATTFPDCHLLQLWCLTDSKKVINNNKTTCNHHKLHNKHCLSNLWNKIMNSRFHNRLQACQWGFKQFLLLQVLLQEFKLLLNH